MKYRGLASVLTGTRMRTMAARTKSAPGLVATVAIMAAFFSPLLLARAGKNMTGGHTGTEQSSHLYTKPDPAAGGGIRMKIFSPTNIVAALAVPQFQTERVYKAKVSGHEIEFGGLPAGKYDLMILCTDCFIEGFQLSRGADSLTHSDRTNIADVVQKSESFFETKKILRIEGTTGDDGKVVCLVQDLRAKPVTLQSAEVRADVQIRSIKLEVLEYTGVAGWQLTVTRELVRTEVAGNERRGLLEHHSNGGLSGIRVTDSVKDLGIVLLTWTNR